MRTIKKLSAEGENFDEALISRRASSSRTLGESLRDSSAPQSALPAMLILLTSVRTPAGLRPPALKAGAVNRA